MFFSNLQVDYKNFGYSPALVKALDYLASLDMNSVENGVYEIQGRDIYVEFAEVALRPMEGSRAEAHKRYIDIQLLIEGKERMGISFNTGQFPVAEQFENRDLIFYERVENEKYLDFQPGDYAIYFPSDAHRPLLQIDETITKVRKAVVKVSVDLI